MNISYKFEEQFISGVYRITPFSSLDLRGYTVKDFSEEAFKENGVSFQPEEILSIKSKRGVLRGIHFQRIKPQAKLIRCISGKVWCVVVDIRKGSTTFGQWVSVDINDGVELYIPVGCALGTLTMEESLMLCAHNEKYYGEYADGIRWDDIEIDIKWPLDKIGGIPILSEKDKGLGGFARLKYV